MLISAGMGIGLMFWRVAEPIFHYSTPSPMFDVAAKTPSAAQSALGVTYYHWGLHPWGIYALVGLSLAFFAYNRGLQQEYYHVTIIEKIRPDIQQFEVPMEEEEESTAEPKKSSWFKRFKRKRGGD